MSKYPLTKEELELRIIKRLEIKALFKITSEEFSKYSDLLREDYKEAKEFILSISRITEEEKKLLKKYYEVNGE